MNQIYLWLSRYIKDIPIQFPSINIDFPCIIWSSFCLCKRINWIIFHYSRCLHVSAIFQFILVFIFTFLFAIIFLELLLIVKINWSRFFCLRFATKTRHFSYKFILLTSASSSMSYYFGWISVESFFTIMTMPSSGSMTTSNTNTTWYTSW